MTIAAACALSQVQYTADAFIDKNKDLLFRDLMAAVGSSELPIAKYDVPPHECARPPGS